MKCLFLFDYDLLPVLFPDYRVFYTPVYLTNKSIYVGNEIVEGEPNSYRCMRILNKQVDLSIPDGVAAVHFAYARKNKKLPVTLEKYISKLSKETLLKELYYFMARGKWEKITAIDVRVYELFSMLTESKRDFLHTYFSLRDVYSFNELWSSMLTFFNRVVAFDPDNSTVSKYYRNIILKFKNQSVKLIKIIQFIMSNHYDEMSLLNFVLKVR